MPTLRIDESLDLYYELDDFTDPWTTPGNYSPRTRRCRYEPSLVRLGATSGPAISGAAAGPEGFRVFFYSAGGLWLGLCRALPKTSRTLLDRLEIAAVHVVGQRVGGSVVMQFAHDYPERVRSLTVIGGPATLSKSSLNPDAWLTQVQQDGVEAWARSTMDRRLGNVSPAMKEWWISAMGKASPEVMAGIFRYVGKYGHHCPAVPDPGPNPGNHQRPERASFGRNRA